MRTNVMAAVLLVATVAAVPVAGVACVSCGDDSRVGSGFDHASPPDAQQRAASVAGPRPAAVDTADPRPAAVDAGPTTPELTRRNPVIGAKPVEGGLVLNVVILPQPIRPKAGQTTVFQPFLAGAPLHEIARWQWRMSGNETRETNDSVLVHEFSEPGQHAVSLTVVHESGSTTNRTITIPVRKDKRPHASFDVVPSDPSVGETVQLSAMSSYDPDGTVVNATWLVDGESRVEYVGEEVEHVFAGPGNHNVTLVVVDDGGNVETVEQTVNVEGDLLAWIPLLIDAFWMSFVSFLLGVTGTAAGCYRRWVRPSDDA
jgi:plastocyanin